ncbi:response regulator transcription factor [Microbacterium sp. GXF6406]
MNFNDSESAREQLHRAMDEGIPEVIAQTATTHFWPLFNSSYDVLIRAIDRVPPRVLDRYPLLRTAHPMTPVLAQTDRPFKPLLYPEEARALSPDLLILTLTAQMIAFRFSGDVAASATYARRLQERLSTVDSDAMHRADGPLWYVHAQIGSTYLLAGDSALAVRVYATAARLASLSPQPDATRFVLARTALALAVRGSLEPAAALLAQCRAEPEPSPAHRTSTSAAETTAAALIAADRLTDDLEEVLAALEPPHSSDMTWPFALLARARAHLGQRRAFEALETIHVTRDSHPPQYGSVADDIIAATSIEAHCAAGEESQAAPIVDAHSRTGTRTLIAEAGLALREGRWDTAAKALNRVISTPGLGPGTRGRHRLLSAWLQFARRGTVDPTTATAFADIAETGDLRRMLGTLPVALIDSVRSQLPAAAAVDFDIAIGGLDFRDLHVRPALTDGERRVLHALSTHGTVSDIAAAFHVSPNTIKSQLKSLYRKLDCTSREEAIEIGARFQPVGAPQPIA